LALAVGDVTSAVHGNGGDLSQRSTVSGREAFAPDADTQLNGLKVDLVLDDDEGFLGYIF
jgi:hypothetical protein